VTTPPAGRTALVLGATGLVGRNCLERLLNDPAYGSILVFARRPAPLAHPRLRWLVVDFRDLEEHGRLLKVDDAFCCLGTTIRSAGSKDAFRTVDFGHVVGAARAASANGAGQLLLVSALGADRRSRMFYSRVKGEAEEAVRVLPFRGTQIFRPSLLLGEREEFRLGERVATMVLAPLSGLLVGRARKYRPVRATAVAAAMVAVAKAAPDGVNVFESDRIAAFAS
jgi:uncharacterized protein YbjT (DUF2867 family)